MLKGISENSFCNISSDNNSNVNKIKDKLQELPGDEEANEENDENINVNV